MLVFEYQSVIQDETAVMSLIFIPDQECLHSLWGNCDIQNMADMTHEASLQFEFINCLRKLGSNCGTVTHFLSFCKNLTAYVRDSSPKK